MKRLISRAAAGVLVLATGACATSVIVDPTWAELPAPEDMSDAYPGFAAMMGVHGTAELRCAGLPDGRLARCVSTWSAPEGLGFDRAALELAPRFRVQPRTVDGEASKSEVQFRVRFSLPEDDVAPYAGPEPTPEEIAQARPLAEKMHVFFAAAALEEGAEELDVDPDRVEIVERILADVRAEMREDDLDAIALGLARVLTPEQITAMTEGRAPDTPPPPFEEFLAAATPADPAAAGRFEERLRAKYCALYACDPKGPSR